MRTGAIKGDRIAGIDALRAFALFGILMVHVTEGFGFYAESVGDSPASSLFISIVRNMFCGRSNAIFSLLFGCSFWFLLRNQRYRSLKFVWRCVLLVAIGIVAKLFYTFDLLLWYGVNGIVLVCFRHCHRHLLLAVSVTLILLTVFVDSLNLGALLFPEELPERYVDGYSIGRIMEYPLTYSIKTGFVVCLSKLSLRTLGLMMLGYWLGREGYVTRWREIGTLRMVAVWFSIVAVLYTAIFIVRGDESSMLIAELINLLFVTQALFMSVLVLYLCRAGGRCIEPFACYGRLGLTNYFCQGAIGVTLFSTWFIPEQLPFMAIAGIMIGFYIMQVVFSVVWCRAHRYGPLEYLWRKATSIIPDRT